jgi:hypothetical protein
MVGRNKQNKTPSTGMPEQDCHDRAASTGPLGQDSRNFETATTGQSERESLRRASRIEQSEQDCQH